MKRDALSAAIQVATTKPFEDCELSKALAILPQIGFGGPWVAGGALRRLLANEPTGDSDIDFFFSNSDQCERFKIEMSAICRCLGGSQTTRETNVTYEIPGMPDFASRNLRVQAITFRTYRSIEALLDSFDFTICQFATDGATLFYGDRSLEDLAQKQLVPTTVTYAVSTIRRITKYGIQGYSISNDGIVSILKQVARDPDLIVDREISETDELDRRRDGL